MKESLAWVCVGWEVKTSKCEEKGTGLINLHYLKYRMLHEYAENIFKCPLGGRRTDPPLPLYSLYFKDNTYSKINTQTTYRFKQSKVEG